MILDRLAHWRLYASPDSPIGKAFHFLSEEFDPSQPDGRIDIDGDRLYILLQTYEPRAAADCKFESHRRYLDIQYIIEGAETIGWTPADALRTAGEYSDEKDVIFYETPETSTPLELRAGRFAVFYPNDGHQPGIRIPGIARVRKAVVKMRV